MEDDLEKDLDEGEDEEFDPEMDPFMPGSKKKKSPGEELGEDDSLDSLAEEEDQILPEDSFDDEEPEDRF